MLNKTVRLACSLVIAAGIFVVNAQADDYANTIAVFKESPAVAKFFDSAYGYAVFPTIGKAGFIVGGAYGKGQVYRENKVTGRSSVFEGSLGLQLGGKAFRQIIFFQDQRSYDEFTSGGFEFDATAQAVIITAGAEGQVGTGGSTAGATAGPRTGAQAETRYTKGMAVFIHTVGGLMGELSVGGQKFSFTPL